MGGLITLVNDNHVDNYLKEILAFVYYGSIVNNWPKKTDKVIRPWEGGQGSSEIWTEDLVIRYRDSRKHAYIILTP